jgi:hypothetical protein
LLRLTTAAIARYRHHSMTFDPTTAAKVARVLDITPMEVIAASQHQRAKTDEEREFWREEWIRCGGESREQIESMAGIRVGDPAYQDADCPRVALDSFSVQTWHP